MDPLVLGLFAFGMCAAGIGFSSRSLEQRLRERVPWKIVVWVLFACCVLGGNLLVHAWFQLMPLSDALVGATDGRPARAPHEVRGGPRRAGKTSAPTRVRVESSGSAGSFLVQPVPHSSPGRGPVLFRAATFALSAAARMSAMIALAVPSSLAVAYAFFLIFRATLHRSSPELRQEASSCG